MGARPLRLPLLLRSAAPPPVLPQFPGLSLLVFQQINSTSISYAAILRRTKQELAVFKAALVAAAAAALAALWRTWGRAALAAAGLA